MEKAKKSEDSLMKVIIKLFKNSRRVISLTLLVIVASVVMTLFPPLVLEQIVNRLTDGQDVAAAVTFGIGEKGIHRIHIIDKP